jgi:hypothetical protein
MAGGCLPAEPNASSQELKIQEEVVGAWEVEGIGKVAKQTREAVCQENMLQYGHVA